MNLTPATAQHARAAAPSRLRRWGRTALVSLAVVLVSAIAVGAFVFWELSRTFSEDAVVLPGQEDGIPDIGELDNTGVNILLAGLDACENEYRELFGDRCPEGVDYDALGYDGVLNDANILVHISPEPRRVTVVSLPRDLMIEVPECAAPDGVVFPAADRSALNESYSRGGLGCVTQTITELTGQQIDYAATITWGGVIEITDAIGGVDVCVGGEGIDDRDTGLELEPGIHSLQGLTALQFLRTRHGLTGGGDLSRISNQQVYLTSMVRKITSSEVLTNVPTMLRLATTTLENVTPSSSLTNPSTLAQIGAAVAGVPTNEFVFVQYPVVEDPIEPDVRLAPNEDAADLLWQAINDNVPITLGDDVGQGVVVQEPDGPPAPEATPTPDPTAEPTPDEGDLGGELSGTNAEQVTCSNGVG